MATRYSRATGNWTTAGTWGLVDSTSFNNTESTTTVVTTSYQASSGAVTGAITVAGIALKLSVRTGTTGTLSAHLAIAGVEVPGTLVTINTGDLPAAATADLNGGWFFLKFSSSVLLVGATTYTVEVKTSSSSQVSLFATSGSNWARALVTTTTGAPAAGDDVIIGGEYLSAGSSNTFTVTMDETASTDYGAASTSLVTPAIAVCSKGVLTWGTTASTAYQLKVSGNLIVYSGGTYNQGSVGGECPRNSSMDLLFDCGSNVDFGITVRNLGTFVAQGLSRTAAKLIDRCKLNTDEAVNSTSLGVDADTGWLDNDEIAVASTTRTSTQSEAGTLNGNAGASSLTVDGFAGAGGGLAAAHSGTSPTQAEVILLTRNVKIRGTSASLQAYIDIKATATVDFDWVEFKWLGSATTNKRGIDCAVTTGSVNIQYCSLHDFIVASSMGLRMQGGSGTGLVFSNNITWNIAGTHLDVASNSGSSIFDSNIFMKNSNAIQLVVLGDVGGTFTNNTMISAASQAGLRISDPSSGALIGTFSNIVLHSHGAGAFSVGSFLLGTINGLTSWRNNAEGFASGQCMNLTINDLVCFGNLTNNILLGSGTGKLVLIDPIISGDSSFSTTNGITYSGGPLSQVLIYNGSFGVASGIKTAHTNDINIQTNNSSLVNLTMVNTLLASSTEIATPANMTNGSFISSQKHDQTAGLHKTWKRYGIITKEVTTVHTGSHSVKMTPNNASNKLECSGQFGGFKVAVANGQTVTPTVYVYEDASYNGARARLIVKRNDAMGITADTVLDTATAASDAAWEALTGTTAAVTDDGTLEFVVDCDGTAGNLFVDSFSAA